MKWIAISGSWRKTNKKIERDVRNAVRKIIAEGNGIVAGGALGVDYFATDEAMKLNPTCQQIKIFLPAKLEIFAKHFLKRAKEGVITQKQAKDLIEQLTRLKKTNPKALMENEKNTVINKEAYYARHGSIISAADELIAFRVNKSQGVQDTIDEAKQKGIPVKIFSYILRENKV